MSDRADDDNPQKRRPLLRATSLSKEYPTGGEPLRVLRGVDMEICRGEFVSVVGLSGVGKSTLLNLLGLLDRPSGGSLVFCLEDDTEMETTGMTSRDRAALRNQFLGFVFQFYHLLPDLDVLENVILPTMVDRSTGAYRRQRKDIVARAEELLERVGVIDRRGHRPTQLSGGERQRVAIARALINRPLLLLCDEPTGNLDSQTSASMHRLFTELNETLGTTTLVVTHDPTLADRADRTLHMVDGVFSAEPESAPLWP